MCRTFRAMVPTVILAFCCVCSPLFAAERPAAAQPSDAAAKKPRVMVTISKETTYIVSPLRPDGYPDYVAALNEYASKGVTPENNAAVLLWQATGPKEIKKELRDEFFRRLGIRTLPEDGDYFVLYDAFSAPPLPREGKRAPKERPPGEGSYYETQLDRAMARPWSKKECPTVAEWLDANAKPIRLIVDATKRPRYYSPLIGASPDAMVLAVLLPGTTETRQMAKMLLARAMRNVDAGNLDAAADDLLACHRLGRLVGQGSTLIEALVGITIEGFACSGDRAFAHFGKPSRERVQKYLAELKRLPPLPKMAERVDVGERFACLDSVCAVAREGPRIIDGLGGGRPPTLKDEFVRSAANLVYDWDQVLRSANSYYDRAVEAAGKSDYRAAVAGMKEWDGDLRLRMKRLRDGKSLIGEVLSGRSPREVTTERVAVALLGLLAPAGSLIVEMEYRAATHVQLTQIALALATHRADHGRYPKRLSELAPKYLAEVGRDLYTGAPLHYARKDDGYSLYSVGPNGKDEGGPYNHGLMRLGVREELQRTTDDVGFPLPPPKE